MTRTLRTLAFLAILAAAFVAADAHTSWAACGDGILDGSEECDPGTAGYPLHINGDLNQPTCSTGSACFFSSSCCKFNCQFVGGTNIPCSDNNPCTDNDVCDQVGLCISGPPPTGPTPCDDGVFCNGADSCLTGACDIHTGDPCSGLGGECPLTCNEAADICQSVPGTPCADDGLGCSNDVCDAAGTCTHPAKPAGTTCRGSAGVCDVAEACDGSALTCPADAFVAAGTQCRASAGVCDVAENCTGADAACPNDAFVAAGTQCRASAGVCDVAEACTGSGALCPNDAFVTAGTECRASAGECDVAEACTGSGALCPNDGKVTAGTACTSDGNPCSLDQCDGTNVACQHPAGNAGTTCRAAAGTCDVAETCTGASITCPTDVLVAAGTTCRGSAGVCDVAETCTGATATCPADVLVAAGTTCRASAGVCDVAEACTGATATCPADAFVTAGTTCRAAAGECDAVESCSGSAAACPSDGKIGSGTACTSDGNPCSLDQCDGTNDACQHPAGNAGTTCRAAAGTCDVAETCTGASTTCPTDAFLAASTVCRASAGECDVAENCTGSAAACPGDSKAPSGTACTSDGNPCSLDQCNGSADACQHPAGNAGTTCRASAGVCDVAEACTGASTACPTDGFAPATTECRAAAVECDAAENCTGSSATCPPDASKPAGTACTSDGNPCTTDLCAGMTCAHAAGNAGTTCRDAVDECDVAEACTGASAACPADSKQPDLTACASDGIFCTQDVCVAGVCEHPDVVGSGPETCYDLVDNNGDCNTDCQDPLCACGAIVNACNHLCTSSIRFGRQGRFCRYQLNGAFVSGVPHDPPTEDLGVLMTNVGGTLVAATLPAGSLVPRGDPGHYIYKSSPAIRLGGFSKVRVYPDKGNPTVTRFNVYYYGDCSGATTPFMTTQVSLGTDVFYTEGDWTERPAGWQTELP